MKLSIKILNSNSLNGGGGHGGGMKTLCCDWNNEYLGFFSS